MATAETVVKWLRNDTDTLVSMGTDPVPSGVCPVLGKFLHDWYDAVGDDTFRTNHLHPLAEAVGASSNPLLEDSRKATLVDWVRTTALPEWKWFAHLDPDDDENLVYLSRLRGGTLQAENSILGALGACGVEAAAKFESFPSTLLSSCMAYGRMAQSSDTTKMVARIQKNCVSMLSSLLGI